MNVNSPIYTIQNILSPLKTKPSPHYMCNKPAFFIIDAASQEVLLVSELTLATAAQTENNGVTLVAMKTPDHNTKC